MKKLTNLIQQGSELACAVSGFGLMGLGIYDIQCDQIAQGSVLLALVPPLLGFVIGKKNPKKGNGEDTTDGN